MEIYCCHCGDDVNCKLVSGSDVYPHRLDLAELPFWRCNKCGNTVGCHHKTSNPTKPLGCISTPEIKNARRHIHAILDPMWKQKKISRSKLYKNISNKLGYQYHTAEIRDIEEARKIYRLILEIRKEVG